MLQQHLGTLKLLYIKQKHQNRKIEGIRHTKAERRCDSVNDAFQPVVPCHFGNTWQKFESPLKTAPIPWQKQTSTTPALSSHCFSWANLALAQWGFQGQGCCIGPTFPSHLICEEQDTTWLLLIAHPLDRLNPKSPIPWPHTVHSL